MNADLSLYYAIQVMEALTKIKEENMRFDKVLLGRNTGELLDLNDTMLTMVCFVFLYELRLLNNTVKTKLKLVV